MTVRIGTLTRPAEAAFARVVGKGAGPDAPFPMFTSLVMRKGTLVCTKMNRVQAGTHQACSRGCSPICK